MAGGTTKAPIIRIFNNVREQMGLFSVASLDADKQSKTMITLFNKVITEISDYDDWQETIQTVLVSAVSGQAIYTVQTTASANIQNIHEVVFDGDIQWLWYDDIDEIRRLNRASGNGRPRRFTLYGTDDNDNPKFMVFPIPGSNEDGKTFEVLYYQKPPTYTPADVSAVPPFPQNLITQGLFAYAQKDEGDMERFKAEYAIFTQNLSEAYNRYNGDTGADTYIVRRR